LPLNRQLLSSFHSPFFLSFPPLPQAKFVPRSVIFGGKAVPAGTFFGSLFLVLLVTAMQVAGMKIGGQYIGEGILIILVLFLAAGRTTQ